MCGIACCIDFDGRGRAGPWATNLMTHRGPDARGIHVEGGRISLEHCRLAIIDPTNTDANQPMFDESGRWALIYNGEVFNFVSLRGELEQQGEKFNTTSDTEVLLKGLLRHGQGFISRLRGMFAFVFVDLETNDLLAARDPVGVKPFYYSMADGLFVCGSELRTVLGHPKVGSALSIEAIAEYLAFGYVSGHRTLVGAVKKLEPGHLLTIQEGRLRITEYWDLEPSPVFEGRQSEAVEQLRSLLGQAVRRSMVSDVPVGLMLSGGLDSTAIAALASESAASRLTSFSVSFGDEDDESYLAAKVAADMGFRHQTVSLTDIEMDAEVDAWIAGLDEPTTNPTWIAVAGIARAAREKGIKVLLSGDGGDEIFGGYNRWMRYLSFHDRIWSRTPAAVRRAGGSLLTPVTRGLTRDIAMRARSGAQLFMGSRSFHDDELKRVLGPEGLEAVRRCPVNSHVEKLHRDFDTKASSHDYLARMTYISVKTSLVEDYLARLDKMGMMHSVEGRVPLLDVDLIKWGAGVTQDIRVTGYEQKALFRQAVATLVPRYILEQPKRGFCPPIQAWTGGLVRRNQWDHTPVTDTGALRVDGVVGILKEPERNPYGAWALATLLAWHQQIRR